MITLTKRPYSNNFTGNPIVYGFSDPAAITDPTTAFQIKVFAKRNDASAFTEVIVFTISPNTTGVAEVDISSCLHPLLSYELPLANVGAAPTKSDTASLQFYIHYRSINLDTVDVAYVTDESETVRWAHKGGVHPFVFRGNAFFASYVPNYKRFYTWQRNGRYASITEKIWLSWLNKDLDGAPSSIKMKMLVTYTDGSVFNAVTIVSSITKGSFYYIPVGITENAVLIAGPAKQIWKWQVWLEDDSAGGLGILTEKFNFEADWRPDYNSLQLHYRNSLGGFDTIRVLGVIQKGLSYEVSEYESSQAPSWVESEIRPALDRTTSATEQLRYKADIGYMTREDQDRLRDAFLNREVWTIKGNRWCPVKLISGPSELTSTSDFSYEMPIEFSIADSGTDFYTPESVDLGTSEPTTNICGLLPTVTGVVLTANTPTAGQTRAVLSFTVTGSGSGIQWRVPGFNNWQDIAYANGSITHDVLADNSFEFQLRAVCSPGNYGAVVSRVVNTADAGSGGSGSITPNSTMYNSSPITTVFRVYKDGAQVSMNSVAGYSNAPFYLPPMAGNELKIVFASATPVFAELQIGTTNYSPDSIGSGTVIFNSVTASAGCSITFS